MGYIATHTHLGLSTECGGVGIFARVAGGSVEDMLKCTRRKGREGRQDGNDKQ